MSREICRSVFRRASGAVVALALGLLAPRAAYAQQKTFYLDRIQIPGAPDDGLVVWRPYVAEKTRFYGSAALGYSLNPLRSDAVTRQPNVQDQIETPVSNQLTMYLTAGAELAGRFSVELSLPISLFQTGGADPQAEGVGLGLERTPVGIYDLRLAGRLKIYESDNRKLRLGAGIAAFLPTGNSVAFMGDDQVTAYVFGTAEYDFGKFLIAGNLGPHFRPGMGIGGPEGSLDVGSELRWTAGVFVPLRQGDVRLGGSIYGSTGIVDGENHGESTFFSGQNTDLEWLAEIRMLFDKKHRLYFNGGGGTRLANGYGGPDIRLLAMIGTYASLLDFGAPGTVSQPRRKAPDVEMYDKDTDGDGYPDEIDLCPTEKEDGKPPSPDDGCPAPKDRDKDGIPDDQDKCPDDPEDKDGIMDADGCPEKDADNDGIPDTEDACPLVPGMKSKDPKKNGCKEEHKAIVETTEGIQLLEPIQFDTGKATIKPVSFPVLDEVVEVLKSHDGVRMGVYGHTDSKGKREMNINLSRARAQSVVNYLASHGIARNRLESDGYGPDQPVASNDTDEGRAKNRRVEFKVIGEK